MPLQAVVFGAGGRGTVYGQYAAQHPDQLQIVGMAEPDTDRSIKFATQHDLPPSACYRDWRDFLADSNRPRENTVVLNTTMDRLHFESTLAALDAGYDVLLEKPMSPVLHENIALVQRAEAHGRLLQICHVLRFTPFFETLRQIVQSGRLGRIISVDHRENLVYWHMAHSFVRGNWRSAAESGPMILSKCCHDFDILYWILRQPVVWLSSSGTLTHFRPENAPEGATARCTDGCPAAEACKYEATRLYVHDGDRFPLNAVSVIPTAEARLAALKTGWYGRCVYHCDNDVVDHQTVQMELADGTTVSLIMNGQGHEECRTMRYDGTRATLYGKFKQGDWKVSIHDHRTGSVERIQIPQRDASGHGGGDFGIVRSFLNARAGIMDDTVTTARESLESHLLAFAAEESRLTHQTIYLPDYRARAEAEARALYAFA